MTGWAIPGVQLRVVDDDGADVRPDGEQIGEIVVRVEHGDGRLLPRSGGDRGEDRDGWFHTGDMATIDEAGYLHIKDRSKDIIIRGGENIGSVEIENAIASHPGVLEAAVVAAPDERWGEVPVALVVLKEGAALTEPELQRPRPRSAGGLQGAAVDRVPRCAAQGRDRQDSQGRAA